MHLAAAGRMCDSLSRGHLLVCTGRQAIFRMFVLFAALGVLSRALEKDMPCNTMVCPVGFALRWDAADVLCMGACDGHNDTDTETCCVAGDFFSHSWRVVAAGNVSSSWELYSLKFYMDSQCDNASVIDTAPGLHHPWRGYPNGAAFAHVGGRGGPAAKLFRSPAEPWTSAMPCEPGSCFIGFRWESNIDRYPLGACRVTHYGNRCASEASLRRQGVRVACVELEQGEADGTYAESLQLQYEFFPIATPTSPLPPGGSVWRVAAQTVGLSGGLAQLAI